MERKHIDEFKSLLGEKNVITDKEFLKRFFETLPRDANITVLRPPTHEQLGLAANYAYEHDIPMFTYRRGFLNEEVAKSDGLLIDLTAMNKIRRIDEPNLLAFVEYGVTFEEMKKALDPMGLRILMPAAATSPSIVRSYVDRDVILANGSTRPYQISIFHAILADGRLWMSGNDQLTPDGHSEFREDFGPMYSYFFHASEDIFGMPYAGKVFIYKRWEKRKVSAHGFNDFDSAIKAAYEASRHDQVFECVVADRKYLSVLVSKSSDEAEQTAPKLAPWNVIFGFDNHEKLVEIWDRQTAQICRRYGAVETWDELSSIMLEKFEYPWYIRDRDHYRGFTETIEYYAFSSKAAALFDEVDSMFKDYEKGHVAIPSYYGAAFYCETDIYCDKNDPDLERLWYEAYVKILDRGAHVGRPRGRAAELIYERMDPENIRMIKNLKRVLDPKGLLNRDQLIKGV